MIKTYGTPTLPEGTPITYVFVYGNMNEYGGIQSILIRLSSFLSKRSDSVILANVHGKLVEEEKIDAFIIPHQDQGADMRIVEVVTSRQPDEIVILGFDPSSAAIGLMAAQKIARKLDRNVRFGVSIFHPRDFFREQEKKHVHFLNLVLSKFLRNDQFIFMNMACKSSHEEFFKRPLPHSIVAPVPIDKRPRAWTQGNSDVIRICSVGRIVPFKAYNFSAPKILKQLRALGHTVNWDIYGHGSHESELRRLIGNDEGMGVNFIGPLSLEKFDETVAKYDVFVGMGTAALQAAQLGVPTILAIDQEPHRTYGYLHQAPFGNVGELENEIPLFTIEGELIKFCQMSAPEKLELSKLCEAAASKYDMDEFICRLSDLPKFENNMWVRIGYTYASIYVWTMRDSLIRRIYRLLSRRGQDAGLRS